MDAPRAGSAEAKCSSVSVRLILRDAPRAGSAEAKDTDDVRITSVK